MYQILPQVTKNHTKVAIPKTDDPFIIYHITLNHDWDVFRTGWISDKMSDGLVRENTLPAYITVYHKGKYTDDLTLDHLIFLEDTQKFPNDISTALSDNIEKFFDSITIETQIVDMYQRDCLYHGYVTQCTDREKHEQITLPIQCGAT